MAFVPDEKVMQVAEAYALDMVDFARERFNVELDGSDQSVEALEEIAGVAHEMYISDQPDPSALDPFVKMIGSYLGEVFRRNHDAEWGWVTLEGEQMPGMRARGGGLFWPWGRAQNRIINGPEDNLWHYFNYLLEKHER